MYFFLLQQIQPRAKQLQSTYPNQIIIYVLEGIEDFIRQEKINASKSIQQPTQDSIVGGLLTRESFEKILVWLETEASAQTKETNSIQDTATYILHLTHALAIQPYK